MWCTPTSDMPTRCYKLSSVNVGSALHKIPMLTQKSASYIMHSHEVSFATIYLHFYKFCVFLFFFYPTGFASPTQNSSETEPVKPTRSTTTKKISGFGEKFKPAAGSWNCGTCLLQNKPSDKKCVACQAPQPSTDSSSKSDSKPAKAPAASLSSLFAPPAGSWECDTCMVQNKPEVVKCVACDTAKPGTGVKPALTQPPVSEVSSTPPTTTSTPATTSTSTTITTTSGLLSFADKFKKPEGAWDCDVCMVQNKAQDAKCVACQSAKPGMFIVSFDLSEQSRVILLLLRVVHINSLY